MPGGRISAGAALSLLRRMTGLALRVGRIAAMLERLRRVAALRVLVRLRRIPALLVQRRRVAALGMLVRMMRLAAT